MHRNDNSSQTGKKTYNQPQISTHKLEVGVFGSYCNDGGPGHRGTHWGGFGGGH